jgi:hypothetical protein
MAVYQTRAYFRRQFGYLTDNPAIGPLLAQHYWAPGNSVTHDATLASLTGEGFAARHLAQACNRTAEEAWEEARTSIAAAATRQYSLSYPQRLEASIRIVHGSELIADNRESEEAMCSQFERWLSEHYPSRAS